MSEPSLLDSIECLYTPTAHLHHDLEAKVIRPGQSEAVTFTFTPREAVKYTEVVTFEINGLSRQSVEITGQGTEMRVSERERACVSSGRDTQFYALNAFLSCQMRHTKLDRVFVEGNTFWTIYQICLNFIAPT